MPERPDPGPCTTDHPDGPDETWSHLSAGTFGFIWEDE